MDKKSLQEQFDMKYLEYVDYLKSKYGAVPYSYFRTETCKSKNQKNSRTKDGLVIHHVGENEHILLGESAIAVDLPFKYQQPDMLVYCNYLEHFLLHIKIFEEYANEDNPWLGIGGCVLIAQQINAWNAIPPEIEWQKNCYNVIKDEIITVDSKMPSDNDKVPLYYLAVKYVSNYLLDFISDDYTVSNYIIKLTHMSSQFWNKYPWIDEDAECRAFLLGRYIRKCYVSNLIADDTLVDKDNDQYKRAYRYMMSMSQNPYGLFASVEEAREKQNEEEQREYMRQKNLVYEHLSWDFEHGYALKVQDGYWRRDYEENDVYDILFDKNEKMLYIRMLRKNGEKILYDKYANRKCHNEFEDYYLDDAWHYNLYFPTLLLKFEDIKEILDSLDYNISLKNIDNCGYNLIRRKNNIKK